MTFLVRVKECLEEPQRFLLEVCRWRAPYDLIVIGTRPRAAERCAYDLIDRHRPAASVRIARSSA